MMVMMVMLQLMLTPLQPGHVDAVKPPFEISKKAIA